MNRIWKKIALVMTSSLVCLLLCEIGFRIYFSHHINYHIEMSRYTAAVKEASPDPMIGHVHKKNVSARLMGVDVVINSDGFRDQEYAAKKPGVYRIVFLGDSLTFGWGVERKHTFEYLLEKKVNRIRPAEIINFGTGNYNTVQEVNLFRARCARYDPDQVTLFYFINDAETASRPSSWAFLAHSRLLTFVWSKVRPWRERSRYTSYRDYYAALYDPDAEGWRSARAALRQLHEKCTQSGIALQVILLPELHQLDKYLFSAQHALVIDFLREHGIDYLDATPALDPAVSPEEYWVARDDAHPNARAHRMIADFVFPFVSRGMKQ